MKIGISRYLSHAAFAAMITSLLLPINGSAAVLGANLVVNGDAETGDTSGWTSTGIEIGQSAVAGVAALPVGVNTGNWVFWGGGGNAQSQWLSQLIDVSDLSPLIDAGGVSSKFSILVQSRRSSGLVDAGNGELRFLDAANFVLGSFSFADNSIVSDVFDWNYVTNASAIPVGTRSVQIFLDSTRTGGNSTDAFFDNVSLVLVNNVPEPGTSALAAGLIAVLGAMTVRKRSNRGG